MRKFGEYFESFWQYDVLRSDGATCSIFGLLEGVENHFALLLIFIREKQCHVPFHKLRKSVRMWLIA